MYKAFQPFFLVAEAPIHAGSGSEVGIVDLPIQRERHTGFPKLKVRESRGVLERLFANSSKQVEIQGQKIKSAIEHILTWFLVQKKGDEHAGSIAFTDARSFLLFLLSH